MPLDHLPTPAHHGFHADYRPMYDPVAAGDAWARMSALFAERLA